MADSFTDANDTFHLENMASRTSQDYFMSMSSPWPVTSTPGAPLIGSTSNPFVFSPFDPSPILQQYEQIGDNDNEPLSAGTSANSSFLLPTPFQLVPDLAFSRLMYTALTPGSHFSNCANSRIGLGLLDVFKQDGTPFEGVGKIVQETVAEELLSFLDEFSPENSSGRFDDSICDDNMTTPLVDCPPSPCLLDEVFSTLALAKAPIPLRLRSRERDSSHGTGASGNQNLPEEPEYDDVFIERGKGVNVMLQKEI